MISESSLHALFGGTFDPIHYGHLKVVTALAAQTGLKKVTFLPNNVPPHRPQPEASPQQRADMVKLAIADIPLFDVDLREMQRDTPSWTIDTLSVLRQERGDAQPLAFIIGQDALLSLSSWHRWQELLDFCHLLVCERPGYDSTPETPEMRRWLQQHLTADPQKLHSAPAGKIVLAKTPRLAISATDIRQRLQQQQSCEALLPPAVLTYIREQSLYRNPTPHAILRS